MGLTSDVQGHSFHWLAMEREDPEIDSYLDLLNTHKNNYSGSPDIKIS
jgi:hypothetical protein